MVIKNRWYWVPTTVTSNGFIRVEALSPEDAIDKVENGDINTDEMLGQEITGLEVTGPPQLEEDPQ